MALKTVPIFLTLLSSLLLVSAEPGKYNRNFTIGLFPDDHKGACQTNDASKGLVFTTSTLPASQVCVNVVDVFSQDNSTGFLRSTDTKLNRRGKDDDDAGPPSGIHYLLGNQDAFDPQANYSRVWHKQVNQTAEPGEWAPWYLEVFASRDCAPGDAPGQRERPLFFANCQTEMAGQCETVPYSVQSFLLRTNSGEDQQEDRCVDWRPVGDSARARGRISAFVVAVAVLAALLLS